MQLKLVLFMYFIIMQKIVVKTVIFETKRACKKYSSSHLKRKKLYHQGILNI